MGSVDRLKADTSHRITNCKKQQKLPKIREYHLYLLISLLHRLKNELLVVGHSYEPNINALSSGKTVVYNMDMDMKLRHIKVCYFEEEMKTKCP
jgi:hypothetical protein